MFALMPELLALPPYMGPAPPSMRISNPPYGSAYHYNYGSPYGPHHLSRPPLHYDGGAGAMLPSSMYLCNPPYGSAASAYHHDYGSPYGPCHLSGPPLHYDGGSMLPPGGLYGVPPLMDRYGMPMRHGPMAPRIGSYLEESSQKKPKGRENYWICSTCGYNNYSFRNVCNMSKCKTRRPGIL